MKKRPPLTLDGDYDRDEIFRLNRADSIVWAGKRCEDDPEIRAYVFDLRRQFRERFTKDFPGERMPLDDVVDVNHFLVLLGNFSDKSYSVALQKMGRFFCELAQSKDELRPPSVGI